MWKDVSGIKRTHPEILGNNECVDCYFMCCRFIKRTHPEILGNNLPSNTISKPLVIKRTHPEILGNNLMNSDSVIVFSFEKLKEHIPRYWEITHRLLHPALEDRELKEHIPRYWEITLTAMSQSRKAFD